MTQHNKWPLLAFTLFAATAQADTQVAPKLALEKLAEVLNEDAE